MVLRSILPFMLCALLQGSCGRGPSQDGKGNGIGSVRALVSQGLYPEALQAAADLSGRVPPGPDAEEALFLQGYLLAYGKSDFRGAVVPLRRLLDLYPKGARGPSAQRLLADCEYWSGDHEAALEDYRKVLQVDRDRERSGEAGLLAANCLLLDDKVGDALTAFKEIIERDPSSRAASSAQLSVANTYLKLGNDKRAMIELRKLLSHDHGSIVRQTALKTLRRLESEASVRPKGKVSK